VLNWFIQTVLNSDWQSCIKNIIPRPNLVCQSFFYCRCFSILFFNQIMVCLCYVKQISNLPSFLWETSCFSHKTSNSCSYFWAEAIYVIDPYLVVTEVSKNFSFVGAVNNLLFFVFYDLSVMHAIFVEELQDCIFILLVCICAKTYFVFVRWLLSSFCYELIQFITHWLNPFSDGKCDKQAGISLYVEVAVRIALFKVREKFLGNIFLFFLTKFHISSISWMPSCMSLSRISFTCSQCSAMILA